MAMPVIALLPFGVVGIGAWELEMLKSYGGQEACSWPCWINKNSFLTNQGSPTPYRKALRLIDYGRKTALPFKPWGHQGAVLLAHQGTSCVEVPLSVGLLHQACNGTFALSCSLPPNCTPVLEHLHSLWQTPWVKTACHERLLEQVKHLLRDLRHLQHQRSIACGVISIHRQLQFRPLSFIITLPARISWRAFFISPSSFVTSLTRFTLWRAQQAMLIRIACIYQRIACTTNTAPSGWVHGLYTYHIFTCICLCILHLHMYIYVIFYEVTVGLLYGIFCIYTLCLYMYVFVLARIFTICVCMNVYS